ncbi:MAG: response regulator, partial [Pseudomonadota bacterium]
MSLRVLLADESASIRKVFQMGLQDFGAEVKSVHSGLDVIEVATHYQPHIVFADILLQKKSGYEVSRELADHPDLSQVPVVLMWSSFMELDQQRYQESGAQGELEKPFDVEAMRGLIQNLVEHTQEQRISEFLNFPSNITDDFVEEEKKNTAERQRQNLEDPTDEIHEVKKVESTEDLMITLEQHIPEEPPHEPTSIFNIQAEDFDMSELSSIPENSDKPTDPVFDLNVDDPGEAWQAKPLKDQKIAPPPAQEETSLDQFQSMDLQDSNDSGQIRLDDFLYKPDTGVHLPPDPVTQTSTVAPEPTNPIQNVQVSMPVETVSKISPAETEAIIRSETRAVLKESIDKMLPKILEKVVREELQNILKEEASLRSDNQIG